VHGTKPVFDAAVVGLGTMGAFACRELARQGASVIGFDRFDPPHNRGSHTGDTRVFRTAYAEHPDYVPLARRAGLLWDQLGAATGTTLLHRTGLLTLGERGSDLIAGTKLSAAMHKVDLDCLSSKKVRSRYPAFRVPPGWEALFEREAGWIDVEGSLTAALRLAEHSGAVLRRDTCLEAWQWTGSSFELRTAGETFFARRLVIAAGAWAGRLLKDLHLPLTVVRKPLVWVRPQHPEQFRPDVFPVFASARCFFYGFPDVKGDGVKMAIHWSAGEPAADPDSGELSVSSEAVAAVLDAAADLLPTLAGELPQAFSRVTRTESCFYTMTPDEHFIIDRHPRIDSLVFAAGFSGHGFKFAPAVGEVLAEMALQGASTLPVGFLGLARLR
jgi:sarcosine oxidase